MVANESPSSPIQAIATARDEPETKDTKPSELPPPSAPNRDTSGEENVAQESQPVIANGLHHEVHSVFSPKQKKFIVLTASTAAFFSPLSSNIYLPALGLLAQDLSVSDSQINLTVTSYLVWTSTLAR